MSTLDAIDASVLDELTTPRPLSEYHEDMGPVLWWCWEPPKPFEQISERVVSSAHNGRWLGEEPYVGTPNDLGREILIETRVIVGGLAQPHPLQRMHIGGWPGYHTHFTPLPPLPKAPTDTPPEGD